VKKEPFTCMPTFCYGNKMDQWKRGSLVRKVALKNHGDYAVDLYYQT
jgi:hypothetical protein